jgi:hypothetical protein
MARSKSDWEAIEREYRVGQLSVVEIARQFDLSDAAIHKKAKQNGWKRDLTEKVKRLVREKLVREEVEDPNASDEQVVDQASNREIKLRALHRKDIEKHRGIVQLLAGQLDDVAQSREDIETTIEKETDGDKDTKRRNSMLKAVSLPTHAGVARDLSVALKNLIPLERQAYGIDNGSEEGQGSTTIIIKRQGNSSPDSGC